MKKDIKKKKWKEKENGNRPSTNFGSKVALGSGIGSTHWS